MTARRRLGAVLLLAGSTVLLTGCGIRPTAVPVDAGAPASRTACPASVLMPVAPAAATSVPVATPAPTGRPSAGPSASPAAAAAVTAVPSPTASAPGGVFGAPSASHCP
ncbi:hypothetical protein [Kitasatospora cheerisanensis]|uniref:hypothetical protein n=1 Tax=Kitasatospora cheerisanensis TaxID=81942 RepID=UPI000689225D|nr:hypothetical protein [Kitasatospora cheerisanensis]